MVMPWNTAVPLTKSPDGTIKLHHKEYLHKVKPMTLLRLGPEHDVAIGSDTTSRATWIASMACRAKQSRSTSEHLNLLWQCLKRPSQDGHGY